ncbi:hypothetical protein JW796_03525 [Candidatus Dojkabacteria bacterium]|nr:hypothetical protein [Candidatus Dojkabacteria bacterium]
MVRILQTKLIQPYLSELAEPVKKAWNQVASNLGFEGLESLISTYKDMRFWLLNAGHVSKKAPTGENGFMSERSARAISNLYIAYSNIMDGLCYSGAMTYGTRIEIGGQLVSDSRELLKRIMPTSNDADEIIDPTTNLAELQALQVAKGRSNTPDRGAIIVLHNGEEFSGLHSQVRVRSTVCLPQFEEAMINSNPGLIGNSRRIEYTGRGSTPDLEKYAQSVAIQEVLTLAGVLSVKDGYDDVFKWLADQQIYTNADSQRKGRTALSLQKALDSLQGNFDFKDLSELLEITKLVETKLLTTTNDSQKQLKPTIINTLARARAGISSLKVSRKEYMDLDAYERFYRYVHEKTVDSIALRPMNWGELTNSFTRDDIERILKTYFNANIGETLSLDELTLLLNHHFFFAQLRGEI